MSPLNTENLNNIADTYDIFKDFDRHLFRKCGEIICPRVSGKRVLEMGCSGGLITDMLLSVASELEIVEGAQKYVDEVTMRYGNRIKVTHSLFEDFSPNKPFDTVVFTNTLHHISKPENLLHKIRTWLVPGGTLHITVPNMLSLHRRIGVKMGVLKDTFDATERNKQFSQPGRYTKDLLVNQVKECGYIVTEAFGFFLKPFSNKQMDTLNLSSESIDALFKIGKEFEDLACLIYCESIPN